MKEIKVFILKIDILDDVSINSAYSGAKSGGGSGQYDRVATVRADEGLLNRYWRETCSLLSDKLQDFVIGAEIGEDALTLDLQVSGAYDDALTPSVRSDLQSALSSGVLARWFRITNPERAGEWFDDSRNFLNKALSKLYQRRKPVKK